MNAPSHQVTRRFRGVMPPSQSTIDESIASIPGLIRIDTERQVVLRVTYDINVISYRALREQLSAKGFKFRPSIGRYLQGLWFDYLDDTQHANLKSKQKLGCCSNPTDVYAQRKKSD